MENRGVVGAGELKRNGGLAAMAWHCASCDNTQLCLTHDTLRCCFPVARCRSSHQNTQWWRTDSGSTSSHHHHHHQHTAWWERYKGAGGSTTGSTNWNSAGSTSWSSAGSTRAHHPPALWAHLDALGLPRDAALGPAALKAAFRAAALRWHPDRHHAASDAGAGAGAGGGARADAEARFKAAQAAYEALKGVAAATAA